MTLKFLQISTLIALFSTSLFAADINLKQSEIKWTGTKVTGKHFGKVPLKSGDIKVKDGKLVSGVLVADLKNYTVEDLEGEWATKFLNHTKGEDFFEVEKYPTATIKIKSVKNNKATADLTIKNKTHEVKFDVNKKGDAFVGSLTFDRTKFGMVYGSKDFFKNLGDKVIHNDVTVEYKIVPKK